MVENMFSMAEALGSGPSATHTNTYTHQKGKDPAAFFPLPQPQFIEQSLIM